LRSFISCKEKEALLVTTLQSYELLNYCLYSYGRLKFPFVVASVRIEHKKHEFRVT